jgi:predicted DNA-binding transcriptional regulator AlpA
MNKELHVTSREFKMSVRNENELIQAGSMRKSMLGGISDMSLWRWLNDPDLAFPRPVVIQRRRFWRKADVEAWIIQRSTSSGVGLAHGARND